MHVAPGRFNRSRCPTAAPCSTSFKSFKETERGTSKFGNSPKVDAGRKPLQLAVWLSPRRSKVSLVSRIERPYGGEFAQENEPLTRKTRPRDSNLLKLLRLGVVQPATRDC